MNLLTLFDSSLEVEHSPGSLGAICCLVCVGEDWGASSPSSLSSGPGSFSGSVSNAIG